MEKKEYSYEDLDVIKDLLIKRDLVKARELIEEYKINYPNDDYILAIEANYLYSSGNVHESFLMFESLINHKFSTGIKLIKCIVLYGDLLKIEGNYLRAKELYYLAYLRGKKCVNKSSTRALYKLADMYFYDGDLKKAVDILDVPIYRDLDDIKIHKASFFIRMQEYDKAINVLNSTKANNTLNRVEVERLFNYGWAYLESEDYNNAVKYFSKIIHLKSLKADMAKYFLAKALFNLKRYDEAYNYANMFYNSTRHHKEDALVLMLDILSLSNKEEYINLFNNNFNKLSLKKFLYFEILYYYLEENYDKCISKISLYLYNNQEWRLNSIKTMLNDMSIKKNGNTNDIDDLILKANNNKDMGKTLIKNLITNKID